MSIELSRPAHVTDEAWGAVDAHRARLERAIGAEDHSLVIGSAKELVESVARVAVEAVGIQLVASNADFDAVVSAAHVALGRQAGPGTSLAPEVRAVAGSAKKIAVALRGMRNDFGTGHGRGQPVYIEEEMATIAVESALLWCRWALRRLHHVLVPEAGNLIRALRTETLSRKMLRESLAAVDLEKQPSEMQHALGIAFAHRAMQGTFVAHEAGVQGPRVNPSLEDWPVDFRLGLAEGYTLSLEGHLVVDEGAVDVILDVLTPVPEDRAKSFIQSLSTKAREAGIRNRSDEELHDVSNAIRASAAGAAQGWRGEWLAFAQQLDPFAEGVEDED